MTMHTTNFRWIGTEISVLCVGLQPSSVCVSMIIRNTIIKIIKYKALCLEQMPFFSIYISETLSWMAQVVRPWKQSRVSPGLDGEHQGILELLSTGRQWQTIYISLLPWKFWGSPLNQLQHKGTLSTQTCLKLSSDIVLKWLSFKEIEVEICFNRPSLSNLPPDRIQIYEKFGRFTFTDLNTVNNTPVHRINSSMGLTFCSSEMYLCTKSMLFKEVLPKQTFQRGKNTRQRPCSMSGTSLLLCD